LPITKNGTARAVPLSRSARRWLGLLRGQAQPFTLADSSRDALWRKARKAAGLEGFTFHDLRHTAATRIGATVGKPGRLSFPQFCAVFGWRNPAQAMVYVNPTAAELADLM
jgi:integrase